MRNAIGAADPGGPGGPGPPLKLEIYLVIFLEKDRISFFFLLGPPLEKNRSSAPDYTIISSDLWVYDSYIGRKKLMLSPLVTLAKFFVFKWKYIPLLQFVSSF